MTDNTITITLDDVLGPDGMEGAWDGMVRGLVSRAEERFLHTEGGRSFHKACVEAISEAVKGKIAERVEALMDKPLQPTDRYGTPTGEPTTFEAMIGAAVEGAMSEKVNVTGQPDRHGKTLMQHALQGIALEGLSKAIKDEARKVNTDAKAAVAKEMAAAIARTLKS